MNHHDNLDERRDTAGPDITGHDTTGDDTVAESAAIQRLLDRPLGKRDLHEATVRMSQPLEPPEKDVARLLVFRAANEQLAIEAVHVAKVTRACAVHRIPHRFNKIIRGLSNVDGDLLLCGDLAELLELNKAESPRSEEGDDQRRMILFGDGSRHWLVEVDAVQGVVPVAPDTFKRPPVTVDAALRRFTTSLVPLDGEVAALLDVELLIAGFQAALP
jgi:chemotaxis-related protein WspD